MERKGGSGLRQPFNAECRESFQDLRIADTVDAHRIRWVHAFKVPLATNSHVDHPLGIDDAHVVQCRGSVLLKERVVSDERLTMVILVDEQLGIHGIRSVRATERTNELASHDP